MRLNFPIFIICLSKKRKQERKFSTDFFLQIIKYDTFLPAVCNRQRSGRSVCKRIGRSTNSPEETKNIALHRSKGIYDRTSMARALWEP